MTEIPERRAGQAVIEERMRASEEDMKEMKDALKSMAGAIERMAEAIARHEERDNYNTERIGRLYGRIDDQETRLRALERHDPLNTQTSSFMTKAICAGIGALFALVIFFVFKTGNANEHTPRHAPAQSDASGGGVRPGPSWPAP